MASDRVRALRVAQSQLGVREEPLGSNWGRRVKRYLRAAGIHQPEPWCAAFVVWCFDQVGHQLTFPHRASVGFFDDWARKHGFQVRRPFRGDLVMYEWESDTWFDHMGFVERVLALRWRGGYFAGLIRTVEGNSRNRVERRWRWCVAGKTRFVRIPGGE